MGCFLLYRLILFHWLRIKTGKHDWTHISQSTEHLAQTTSHKKIVIFRSFSNFMGMQPDKFEFLSIISTAISTWYFKAKPVGIQKIYLCLMRNSLSSNLPLDKLLDYISYKGKRLQSSVFSFRKKEKKKKRTTPYLIQLDKKYQTTWWKDYNTQLPSQQNMTKSKKYVTTPSV